MKKLITLLLCIAMTTMLMTACESPNESGNENTLSTSVSSTSSVELNNSDNVQSISLSDADSDLNEYFADGDYKDVTNENYDAEITLSGNTGTISDTTRGSSGSEVTITSKGIYHVTGSSDGAVIVINDTLESGNVYLVLDNVSMTNSKTACIRADACDKLIIQCVGDNKLTLTANESDGKIDGAIYSKDDVTINGSGTLSVSSGLHGIVCNDDLKLTGATLEVNAESIGLKAGDSVRIGGGTASVTSGHDGIQVENDEGDSYLYMESGTVTISADYDGIDVDTSANNFTGYVTLAGGTLDITAGGGSGNSKNDSKSQKGIKCEGDINISDITLSISSPDDAVHSNSNINITSGTIELSSSDDGITATSNLNINDGQITVSKSYEGLEAETINISGGKLSVYASDDGINAAGGSDSSSTEQGPWSMSSSTGTLNISGGSLYVNANGDGLDSNGSIYVTGGLVIVEGPEGSGNGAIDKGDGNGCVVSISGGCVLAIGSSGMAINFDSGTQCSALVNLSGSAGTTITVDDGSGFEFTTSKSFQSVVYSSPDMKQGSTYTISAGNAAATMNFSSSLYYSEIAGMGGMSGQMGGGMGGPRGGW